MSSEKIIKNCAPTLAGIKTANLFNEYFTDKRQLISEVRQFNQVFSRKGLRMIIIAIKDNRALIYLYRIKDLQHDFTNFISHDLLQSYGYDTTDIYISIKKLMEKINSPICFPHEIGLFLGYPPEDVKGFIDNNGNKYKTFGEWKVYGDPEKAIKTFNKYRTCRKIMLDRLNMGFTLKQLIIEK